METEQAVKSLFIAPHKKVSRPVEASDLPRLVKDGNVMTELCRKGNGIHVGGYAVAHSQIEETDPLRFFVLMDGSVVINPEITLHTHVPVRKSEGCLSFPTQEAIPVLRWNKCKVRFLTFSGVIDPDNLSWEQLIEINKNLSSTQAQVFQHEIDHMDGLYITDRMV